MWGQSSQEPPAGQPFYLDLMHQLATQSGDPDADFTHNLAVGVPLSVATPSLHSSGIWLKSELSGLEHMGRDMEESHGKANYPSAVDFTAHIRATFIEEVALGMVEGPLSKPAAGRLCQCQPEDLCPGPLAAIDKGTRSGPSTMARLEGPMGISRTTDWRGPQPLTVLDCVHTIHWLHSAQIPGAAGATGPDSLGMLPQGTQTVGSTGTRENSGWRWPFTSDRWVLLKADVTKAGEKSCRRTGVFKWQN